MAGIAEAFSPILALFQSKPTYTGPLVEFWKEPERCGWLMKQGEHIKTWRRRWFVLKSGHIFWFKSDDVTNQSQPRGCIEVKTCLSVKGAEDAINKPFAFEISTRHAAPKNSAGPLCSLLSCRLLTQAPLSFDTCYFIADSDKEKEDWINAIGRAIVRHSSSLMEEVSGY